MKIGIDCRLIGIHHGGIGRYTLELVKNIAPGRIKIIETVWDDSLREGGKVLAIETDKAFKEISADSDWAFYIQGDEVIHEKDLPLITEAMQKWKDNKNVEGLLFNYNHFYGSYEYLGDSRRWYRKEVRIIRNDKTISSYRDAQGFRKNGEKLKVKPVNASVYHYGWAKPPQQQQAKQESFHKMWHSDDWMKKNIAKAAEFDYSNIDSLKKFEGTHPAAMAERIKNKNWKFDFDPAQKKLSLKDNLLLSLESLTGYRVGEYRNYKII